MLNVRSKHYFVSAINYFMFICLALAGHDRRVLYGGSAMFHTRTGHIMFEKTPRFAGVKNRIVKHFGYSPETICFVLLQCNGKSEKRSERVVENNSAVRYFALLKRRVFGTYSYFSHMRMLKCKSNINCHYIRVTYIYIYKLLSS